MKKLIYFLFVTVFCFQVNGKAENISTKPSSSEQFSKSVAGVYKSDFNELTLYVNGNHVTGTYKFKGGKVDGILSGHTLTGTWSQTNGKGKLVFVFNSDFSAFTGKWSYNNDTPTGKWNGTKIAGGTNAGNSNSTPVRTVSENSKIAGVYSTDFKNMTLTISGNHVTGTYEHAGGRIDGTLSGHTLTGTWTQTNGKGKLVFVFNNDFSSFSGKWGYNNDAPTSKWNGRKISGGSNVENSSSAPVRSVSENSKIAGGYATDFKNMTLTISGNHVTGTYEHAGGRIDGILSGHTLTGTWTQTNGKGKLVFVFNSDFSSFSGKWGYNNDAPTSKWNGRKISGSSNVENSSSAPVRPVSESSKITGVYATDFKNMTLTISGNHVTGTYEHAGGRIDGILSGHTLTGTWTQTNGKGKLVFVFNSDFSSFTGKWSYNNDAPTSKWNGTKL